MTDRLHKSGFKMHATLLRQIFSLVETGQVTLPLFDPATQPPGQTNQGYMREYVLELLAASFPNLTRPMIQAFVVGLFDPQLDLAAYKTHLRDFLIQLKVWGWGGVGSDWGIGLDGWGCGMGWNGMG